MGVCVLCSGRRHAPNFAFARYYGAFAYSPRRGRPLPSRGEAAISSAEGGALPEGEQLLRAAARRQREAPEATEAPSNAAAEAASCLRHAAKALATANARALAEHRTEEGLAQIAAGQRRVLQHSDATWPSALREQRPEEPALCAGLARAAADLTATRFRGAAGDARRHTCRNLPTQRGVDHRHAVGGGPAGPSGSSARAPPAWLGPRRRHLSPTR
jgi:hypothetical protein